MTLSLLDKCEPPAVVSQRESGVSPFVFLCDHSGRRIPARLNDLNMSQDDLKRHIAWDIGIEGVGRALSSYFDACLIMQPYSRLVIDCNRRPGSETSILAVSDGTKFLETRSFLPKTPPCACAKSSIRITERSRRTSPGGAMRAGLRFSSHCTASRRSMPIFRGRGTRVCSTTVILTCR